MWEPHKEILADVSQERENERKNDKEFLMSFPYEQIVKTR